MLVWTLFINKIILNSTNRVKEKGNAGERGHALLQLCLAGCWLGNTAGDAHLWLNSLQSMWCCLHQSEHRTVNAHCPAPFLPQPCHLIFKHSYPHVSLHQWVYRKLNCASTIYFVATCLILVFCFSPSGPWAISTSHLLCVYLLTISLFLVLAFSTAPKILSALSSFHCIQLWKKTPIYFLSGANFRPPFLSFSLFSYHLLLLHTLTDPFKKPNNLLNKQMFKRLNV